MATQQDIRSVSLNAAADLSTTGQFRFMKLSTPGVDLATSATADIVVGVCLNNPVSGAPAEVQYAGIAKVTAGAAVSFGATVTTDSTGRAVAAASTNRVHGFALKAASGAGEIIEIFMTISNQILA